MCCSVYKRLSGMVGSSERVNENVKTSFIHYLDFPLYLYP